MFEVKTFCLFQVVYRKQRQCCVTCGEQGSVSLPCGHGLQCDSCSTATECPLCSEHTLEQPLSWLHHPLGPQPIPPHQVWDSQIPAFHLNRYWTVTSRSKWGLGLLTTQALMWIGVFNDDGKTLIKFGIKYLSSVMDHQYILLAIDQKHCSRL